MNSQAQEDGVVTVGRIGAPHGVKGELRVHSFTEPKENIINYLPWLVNINEQWQQIEVLSSYYNGKHIVARIAGYHDRDLAGRLCHSDIGIYHTQLPDLDPKHYYWADLLGLQV
ncbi:MAG: ribosome maturation factor RimM, partial [Gammaproteobacteria bacterium]